MQTPEDAAEQSQTQKEQNKKESENTDLTRLDNCLPSRGRRGERSY